MEMFQILVLAFCLTNGLSLRNNSAVLISRYAKVSRWNSNNNTAQETGRGYSNQDILTPRSSSSSNNRNHVVYQYPVYKKDDETSDEKLPGIGEVIQDRFQVRPFFAHLNKGKDSALEYLPPAKPVSAPIRQAPPPAAPPIINVPVQTSQVVSPPGPVSFASPASLPSQIRQNSFNAPTTLRAPTNLYDSPFSSYNPPSNININNNQEAYPPNPPSSNSNDNTDLSSSIGDSYVNMPPSDNGPYNYQPDPKAPASSPKPFAMPNIGSSDYKETIPSYNNYYDSPNVDQSPDKQPSMHPQSHGDDKPPNYPPKSIDDIYYPPDFPVNQIPNHQKPSGMPMDNGMPMDMAPHGMPMDMPPPEKENGDMTMDLVPPGNDHDFPKYLYDSHHYDHHVYEEVPHTTVAPEPEKKRVSTTNYSYYYLGRKLWYIPLYFSIYFMFYVTALILKSIARHKVTLRNDWISANSRSGRDLTFDHIKTVDNIHRNVSIALDKAGKLYSDIYM